MKETTVIVSVGITILAIFATIFLYRTTVVFGLGGDLSVDDGTLYVESSDNRVGVRNKTPNFTFDVTGDINTTTKVRESGFVLIPMGTIVMWTGSTAPSGWALCDGNNGTPDLRGRFVLSQGQGTGLTNRVIDQVGGAETHLLTSNEMPSHTHTGTTASNGSHNHTGSTSSDGTHTHTGTTNTTGAHTHTVNNTVQKNGIDTPDGLDNEGNEINTVTTVTTTTSTAGDHSHTFTSDSAGVHSHSISTDGDHNHTFTTDATGSGQAHNNMPPFYVLAYIMKL
jgi:microcystin-dependent protein